MKEQTIFHIDVNSAYLSWEATYRIHHLGAKVDLRNIPSAVGGDQAQRHGIILAKSIPSKKYNIITGESLVEARQKCPDLVIVPPNYDLYERCSRAFMSILREYCPAVEQYSIDEAYMDMTGCEKLWGEPIEAAKMVKERIKKELGFTVNVGISENKLLAKMASDFQKPDRVHTLWRSEIENKMWPLPVRNLFFVGRATEKKLINFGIRTIGELAHTDVAILRQSMKKHGELIWQFANGYDVSVVQDVAPPNKGYGNSITVPFDVCDASTARLVLLSLAETVAKRLRAAKARAEVVAVGIKLHDFSYQSKQTTLMSATNITNEIHGYACQLFDSLWDGSPIRHLGIHTSRVRDGYDMRQINMFDMDCEYEKWEKLDVAIDKIRSRYGNDSVKRACFTDGPIDHLAGGIPREKRSVDYSRLEVK